MCIYELYEHEKEYCELMAKKFCYDANLFNFYLNAAAGFEIKQSKLTLQEAAQW